jgi:hypothetical protein
MLFGDNFKLPAIRFAGRQAGMQKIAKGLLERRKKRRIEEEPQLQKEKELMELSQFLICRGIEMVL